jgi:hypothetical protein
LTGLESLRSFRNVLMIFFTSVIIWLLETVKYWFVMHAFNFQRQFFRADADEWRGQSGDDPAVSAGLRGHV